MPQKVLVSGHGFVEFPDEFTPQQIQALLQRDFPPPPPTVGETLKSAAGAFAQGAADTVASIPKAVGIGQKFITGSESPVEETLPFRFGQGISDAVSGAMPQDPRLQGKSFWASTVPQAIGSTVGFAGAGLAGAAARVPAMVGTLATGAAAGATSGYEDAKAHGADDSTAFMSTLLNASVGMSEAIPIAGILTRINRTTRGALKSLMESAQSAVEEGAQEAIQTAAADLIAKNLYDEDRVMFQQVAEGGAAGAISGFLMTILGKGIRSKINYPELPEQPADAPADPARGMVIEPEPVKQEVTAPGDFPITPQAAPISPQTPEKPVTPSPVQSVQRGTSAIDTGTDAVNAEAVVGNDTKSPANDTNRPTLDELKTLEATLRGNQLARPALPQPAGTEAPIQEPARPKRPAFDPEAENPESSRIAGLSQEEQTIEAVRLGMKPLGSWTEQDRQTGEALRIAELGSVLRAEDPDTWRMIFARADNEDRFHLGQKPRAYITAGLDPRIVALAKGDGVTKVGNDASQMGREASQTVMQPVQAALPQREENRPLGEKPINEELADDIPIEFEAPAPRGPAATPEGVSDDDIPASAFEPKRSLTEAPPSYSTAERVQSAIDAVRSNLPSAAPVVVVQSVDDLPAPLRQQGVQGAFWKGQTYLVADNIKDDAEAVRKFMHEQVGHYGLRSVLGADLDSTLDLVGRRLKNVQRGALDDIARTYDLDPEDAQDLRHAAEEYIARLAESQAKDPSLWQTIVAAIKKAWRKITGADISEDEIRALIRRAYRQLQTQQTNEPNQSNVERPEVSETDDGAAGASFSKSERATTRKVKAKATAQDAEYLAAVERGDMETAQRLVDEAAGSANYRQELWHGTNATKYTEGKTATFNTEAKAQLEAMASRFGIREYDSVANVLERLQSSGILDELGATNADVIKARELTGKLRSGESTKGKNELAFSQFSLPSGELELGIHLGTEQQAASFGDVFRFWVDPGGMYDLPDLGTWNYQSVIRELRKAGVKISEADYDSIFNSNNPNESLRKKLVSIGINSIRYKNEAEGPGRSLIVLDPSQIKSADPVTRDDAGNVIPLSQRFDRTKDDIRFSKLSAKEFAEKESAILKRLVAARSSGNSQEAVKIRAELDALEKSRYGFTAKPKEDPFSDSHGTPAEPLDEHQYKQAVMDIEGATANPTADAQTWWQSLKRWLRNFGSSLPELPMDKGSAGKFAAVRRWYRAVSSEGSLARTKAERMIQNIVAPITKLGRVAIDPNTLRRYEDLTNAIQKQRAKGEKADSELIDKLNKKREELRPAMEKNPMHLFKSMVIWRDIAYRTKHIKTEDGNPVEPPAGMTLADVERRVGELQAAVEASEHKDAIKEALKRHYEFVQQMQQEIEDHGEVIPPEMKNPEYFPHHILEGWSGRLANVRATTEGPWRYYLIPITGTEKLHQSDYLAAMYKHAVDVLSNNAQVDLVERDIKPYDISKRHQAELTVRFGEEIAKKLLYKEKYLPPGYKVINPSQRLKLSATYIIDRDALSEKLGVALTSGDLVKQLKELGPDLNITADDIREALTTGSEQTKWIVPVEVADALEGIKKREDAESNPGFGARLMQPLATVQKYWKRNTLFNPLNYPRYEYGNTMTDIVDKVWGLDPGMAPYMKRALKEYREGAAGNSTPEYDAALKEGVFQTVTAGEAEELAKLAKFEDFLTDGGKAWNNFKKLVGVTTGLSQIRESTFRYAKFLADIDRIRKGERPVYGGALNQEVEAQQTPEQKAGLISRKTFGDYEDISVAGAFLRRYVFPFWSWQEVNLKYHVNLLRNMVDMVRLGEIVQAKNAGKAVGIATTKAAVGIAVRLAVIRLGVEMWNQIGGPMFGLWDDDDDLEAQLSEADRRRLHIILGKDDKGRVRVAYLPNAFADVAEWFGGNNFSRLAVDWARGDISLERFAKDFSKQLPGDIINKVAQGIRPEAKFGYMMVSGKDPFPDVLNQRSIDKADWYWMLGQAMDRDIALALRSQLDPFFYSPESAGDWWQRKILQVRRRDPEQWAWFEIRDLASDWKEEKTGKRFEFGSYMSADQKVIRNFRKAIYNADMESAKKFYLAALDLGYTSTRFKASLRAQDPLSDLNADEKKEFEASLNPYEKRMLGLARRYYSRLSSGKGKEAELFPKKAGQPFTPRPDRLETMMRQ